MHEISVSVIVPNYNHAPFLEQRLNSILNQTYQGFELIIMDDCSSDESRDVIDQYANHPKVSHIVYNEKNSGSTFKQWEKGIALANGEWIWIAESDDWAEPNFLEELICQTNGSPNTNLAFTQLYLVQEKSQYISARFEGKNLHHTTDGLSFVQNQMLPHLSIWNASQAIFRKAAFYKISSEYLNYKLCGDWIFWSEISLLGDVFY
ncbi:glycosyltransferase family 2 protein [Sphingobacterium populi]|uniref:glycosyltransferase family 2 protein n=1 Tax=Sphingobacterium sp. CFCC 11742 TaxID=1775560 RepID=UPI00082F9F31|nr:glycosyltransferase [Sphingobacterium sp. CFCC 11742]